MKAYAITDLPERIAARVVVDPDTRCWLWQGSTNREDGYGHLLWDGKLSYVHRVVYEHAVGRIPDGHVISHAATRGCRYNHCCNPAHLEAVTFAEMSQSRIDWMAARARRTHCPHGHEFTPENTYIDPSRGFRQCRECRRRKALRRSSQKSCEIPLDLSRKSRA